jgi:hypothetical protein
MVPEISLDRQRPAQYVFYRHVDQVLPTIGRPNIRAKEPPAQLEHAEERGSHR